MKPDPARSAFPTLAGVAVAVVLTAASLFTAASLSSCHSEDALSGGVTGEWSSSKVAEAGPSPRLSPSMVYAPDSGSIYVFGGAAADESSLNDMWVYDPAENQWTKLDPSGQAPPYADQGSLIRDPQTNDLLVLGGESAYAEAWIYHTDGDSWESVDSSGTAPAVRLGSSLVYVPTLGKALLFGGLALSVGDGFATQNDLWSYDLSTHTWEQIRPAGPRPGPRAYQVMVYDQSSGKVMLYGGVDVHPPGSKRQGASLDETWEYDPSTNTWTELRPAGPSPPAGLLQLMVFAPDLGQVVLCTWRSQVNGESVSETWRYDRGANRWLTIGTSGSPPPPLQGFAIAYDSWRHALILYGGAQEDATASVGPNTALVAVNRVWILRLDAE